jgi:hypothetical protein
MADDFLVNLDETASSLAPYHLNLGPTPYRPLVGQVSFSATA